MAEEYILRGPSPVYVPAKGGLGYEIFRSMQLNINKTAEYFIDNGQTTTYGDLLRRSKRIALYLRALNLKKDDVVCLCSQNHPDAYVPFYASKFIDVTYASIEPTLPDEDFEFLLNYLAPKVLFITEQIEERIEQCLKRVGRQVHFIVLGRSQKYLMFEEIASSSHPQEDDFSPAFVENLNETAVIFLSSGTTGKPKGTCCSHFSLLSQTVNFSLTTIPKGLINMSNFNNKHLGGREDYVSNLLLFSPLYWVSCIIMLLTTTFQGTKKTIGSTFKTDLIWKGIDTYKTTITCLPPGQVGDLYESMTESRPNSSVEVFITGGGLVKTIHMQYVHEMFPNATVYQMMGMTEVAGPIAGFLVDEPNSIKLQNKYPNSCGQLLYGLSCKIVDVDTAELCGPNQQGELYVKTDYIMNGYYKIDTSSLFDKDGWFKTGDLACYNEDKCLFIIDRLKDILLYTLFNIRPSVIEDILQQHPSVAQCCVIGIPHVRDNEHPMGVVVLKKNYRTKITADELIQFVNERVPSDRYKIRAGIKFVDEMLRTPTGKIRKIAMKNLIIEGKM